MSLTLTTFSSGAAISATTLRARIASIEDYLNEGIIAADRTDSWLESTHIYRPDFYGAPNPHTRLASGESYFRQRSASDSARAFFTAYVNTTGWLPVPGLGTTIQIPQSLAVGTYYYRVRIAASFYVYEFGGVGDVDDSASLAGSAALSYNGTVSTVTSREVYRGANTGTSFSVPIYARKQHSMSLCVVGSSAGTGVINVGVVFQNSTNGLGTATKHVIFQQGNLSVRYYLR